MFCLFLDTQYCTLKFGTWTYDGAGINLTAESNKGQLDAYVTSAEWNLEDFSATNNSTKYDCCPNVYPYVLYTIRIRRRSLYYITNTVVPCFLISCMTLLGLVLPPDSGDKITLQITTLLTIVMFSLLLSDFMPPSSTAVPLITVYFMCVMIMSVVSVGASVLVLSLHFRNSKTYTIPLWIRKYICNYLAWLLCMNRPNHDLSWHAIRRRWASTSQKSNNIDVSIDDHHFKIPSEPLLNNAMELSSTNVINIDREPLKFQESREKQSSDSLLEYPVPSTTKTHHSHHHQNTYDIAMICSKLHIISSQLAILTRHSRQEEKDDDESQEWKFMARVIDRLCLMNTNIIGHNLTSVKLSSVTHHSPLERCNNENSVSDESAISNTSHADNDQMEFETTQETSYSLRDNSRKAVCAFALFTIIAMTIGIITVCLGLPKET
ncbi:unnamed protein product, partial [Rotaria sordida]